LHFRALPPHKAGVALFVGTNGAGNKERIMLSSSRLQSIIWTSRLEAARAFYQDVLGLTLRCVSDGALVFDVNGSDLRVSPVPLTRPSEHTVMGFAVTDLDAELDSLRERDVVIERFEGLNHDVNGVLTTPDGARVAWFRDPDGNILSVVQFAR
jgi:catechol 2,3-dioxygenase-like lactoylglutathione lyase family enzyme